VPVVGAVKVDVLDELRRIRTWLGVLQYTFALVLWAFAVTVVGSDTSSGTP